MIHRTLHPTARTVHSAARTLHSAPPTFHSAARTLVSAARASRPTPTPTFLFLFAQLVASALAAIAPTSAPGQSIRAGDIALTCNADGGATVKVHGAVVSFGGSLWAVAPDWNAHYYGVPLDGDLAKTAVVEDVDGGKRLTLRHALGEGYPGDFEATQTFLVRPDNSLTVTLTYRMTGPAPAVLEWGVAHLWASPLGGMPGRIVDAKGEREFTMPYDGVDPDFMESVVAQDFTRLSIDGRLGPVVIEVSPGAGVLLSDYRKNKYADPNQPLFWLGCYEQPIVFGETVTKSVTIRFPETAAAKAQKGADLRQSVKTDAIATALAADRGRRAIVPTPKEFKAIDSRLRLSPETRVYVGSSPGEKEEKALWFLLHELNSRGGLVPVVVREKVAEKDIPAGSIALGQAWRFPIPKDACAAAGLSLPDHGQGYALQVDSKGAWVASATGEGLFNGVTTLVQLLGVEGDSTFLHGAAIRDWPALNVRGIHCLSTHDRADELARCVRDLMGRFKINTFLWEVEYIEWDSHPEIRSKEFGMSKADARKVIAAARENGIELIPQVSSLGHMEWVFKSGHHLDLAEDPERPYAYAVSNPDSYALIYDIFQEALDLFQPRILHLGHDEVTMRGRYPWKSKDLGDMADLFVLDMKRHVDWLNERGVGAMIWGDMALAPDESVGARNAKTKEAAKRIRDGMSKDVIIADWQYDPAPPERQISLGVWKKDGFKTIGCGWDNPLNIANLAKACVDQDALGYLQTTWAGFNFAIEGNEKSWPQYWSWILAAQYAWTGENTPPDELPFDVRSLFLDTMFPQPPRRADKAGFVVDLRDVANCTLADTVDRQGWLGFGPEHDFSDLAKRPEFQGPVHFQIRANEQGRAATLLSGTMNPAGAWPASVAATFDARAVESLHFLMNASYAEQPNTTCGEIAIQYADGGTDTIVLRYGANLFSPSEANVGKGCRIAWQGKTSAGEAIRAWDLEWANPNPKRPVTGFILCSKTTCAAPVLFAVTGVDGAGK